MSALKKDKWRAPTSHAARLVGGLFRSRNHIWNNDQKIVAKQGLTWAQFSTLFSLRQSFPGFSMSPTQICEAAQLTSGGLAKLLQTLENEGLVSRFDNPDDGRSRYVKLTKSGQKKVEFTVEKLVEANETYFEKILSEKETKDLVRLLQKLSAGLDEIDR